MSKVLLIDPQTGYLDQLEENLSSSGIEVHRVPCAVSGLEFARTNYPDLIISQERLEGLDVIDFLDLKRQDKTVADIPVLVASTSARRKLDCYRHGCDDFIQFPVDEPELIFRVCAALRRAIRFALSGNFDQISFVDVLQMLVAARRDGKLLVEGGSVEGELIFAEGQVVFARLTAGTLGEDAFLQLLRATRNGGSFVFISERFSEVETNIHKRTDHLLLGFANMLDEENAA